MKILIADDSELSRFMLKQSLQKVGNQVILARNGQEALDKVIKEPVDLIISDVMMPQMDATVGAAVKQPEEYLRGYSERVVQKLEEMVLKLEQNVSETRATNEELKTLLEVAYLINANLNLGDLLFSVGQIVLHSLGV